MNYEKSPKRVASKRKFYSEHKDYWRKWRKEHRDSSNAADKKYRESHKDKIALFPSQSKERKRERQRRYSYSRFYNITLEQYNDILLIQNGVCAICGQKGERILCVDHNHATGKVRGLLCDKCNRGLGFFREDKTILIKALGYLNE